MRGSGPGLAILGIAVAAVVVLLAFNVWPQVTRTPVDESRSLAAKRYFDTRLVEKWPSLPGARESLRMIEIRGDEMLVLTNAPSDGDQRPRVAPLCFVGMDYVDLPTSGIRIFRIVASDGRAFRFEPKVPCLMLGY